jgi:hypothetical protein
MPFTVTMQDFFISCCITFIGVLLIAGWLI